MGPIELITLGRTVRGLRAPGPRGRKRLAPIRGPHHAVVPELMAMPWEKMVELEGRTLIRKASEILQRPQWMIEAIWEGLYSGRELRPLTPWDLNETVARTLIHEFLQLAVHRQWQEHAPERFLKLCKKFGGESPRGNQLWAREITVTDVHRMLRPSTTKAYYVAYTCPSTGKLYVSGVPEEACMLRFSKPPYNQTGEWSADKAMAWKFGLKLREYQQLEIEA